MGGPVRDGPFRVMNGCDRELGYAYDSGLRLSGDVVVKVVDSIAVYTSELSV